jgi:predicted Zn-ribbon and HTH transcriptional regulator
MTIKIFKCLRCEHEWASKMDKPLVCPKCKSPYWNTPKKEEKGNDE